MSDGPQGATPSGDRVLGRREGAGDGRIGRVVVARATKSFGSAMALRGVDVTFQAGELTLLEGANGWGSRPCSPFSER
ncbi:MAG: hypothetical protein WKG00_04475 [Polyangiaceae bacterium]